MPDTGMWKIAHKFFDFHIKKRDFTNLFDHFLSTVLFSISFCLYRKGSLGLCYSLFTWRSLLFNSQLLPPAFHCINQCGLCPLGATKIFLLLTSKEHSALVHAVTVDSMGKLLEAKEITLNVIGK